MKKLMAATAVLALLAGTSALAQDEHKDRGDRGGAPAPHAAPPPAHAAPPAGQMARPAPAQAQPAGQRYPGPAGGGYQARPNGGGGAPAYQPQSRGNEAGAQGYQHQGRGEGAPAYQPQGRGAAQGYRSEGGQARGGGVAVRPGWGAPGGGDRAPRYDQRYYPREMRPDHQFRWQGGDWRQQRGFYYHRWAYGEFLPFGWFDRSYWVSDYWDYGLPVPPYGYSWVRVGPDVLLINIETGFVAETVYGLFY